MHKGNPVLNIQTSGGGGGCIAGSSICICRYLNKIKRTSHLGKLPALSLEILGNFILEIRKKHIYTFCHWEHDPISVAKMDKKKPGTVKLLSI